MSQPSLRRTFLLSILATITLGFAVFAVFVDRLGHINRIEDIDAELIRAEQGNVGTTGPGNDAQVPPLNPGAAVELQEEDAPIQLFVDVEGTLLATGVSGNPLPEATLVRLATVDGVVTLEDGNFRARVTQLGRGQVSITALSLDLADQARIESRRALAAGATVILALVAVVTWLLVGQLTRPITRLAAAATQIADGDLDTDLSVSAHSREISELADDLDRMLNQIRSTIEQSEQSAAQATRARDDMTRFLADVAHEFRTPLTSLKGYSDLYAGGMLAEAADVDRAMSRIGSESERLYRLVDEMLELARTGSSVSKTEPVDVSTIAGAVAHDLKAANPELTIVAHKVSAQIAVEGIPAQVHQAILNLGANACNHSEAGDVVCIEVDADDDWVTVRVIDHGPGVSDAEKQQIFLPFFRADQSRVRRGAGGGAGLGLALTKQIVTQHRGNIEVADTPGGGATFILTFPNL